MELEKLVTSLITTPPSSNTSKKGTEAVKQQSTIPSEEAEVVDSLKVSESVIPEKKKPVKKKIYPRMLYYKTKVASNKRYRTTLKGRFQQLRMMLQPSGTEAMKKPELLNRAIDRCSHLKKSYAKMKAENDALRAFIKREVDAEPQFLIFDNKWKYEFFVLFAIITID